MAGRRAAHAKAPLPRPARRPSDGRGSAAKPNRAVFAAPKSGYFAVHRRKLAIFHDELEPNAFALLSALARGEPLGVACESAARDRGVDVESLARELEHWFSAWAARGYLV